MIGLKLGSLKINFIMARKTRLKTQSTDYQLKNLLKGKNPYGFGGYFNNNTILVGNVKVYHGVPLSGKL